MKLKKIFCVFLATVILFTVFTVGVLADYVDIHQDIRTVDDYQCFSSSKYDETRVFGYSTMTALNVTEEVKLKTIVALDIMYTTGNPYISDFERAEETVNTTGKTITSFVSATYDTTRIISYFRFYHWYYANGDSVDGVSYLGYYNGITG